MVCTLLFAAHKSLEFVAILHPKKSQGVMEGFKLLNTEIYWLKKFEFSKRADKPAIVSDCINKLKSDLDNYYIAIFKYNKRGKIIGSYPIYSVCWIKRYGTSFHL